MKNYVKFATKKEKMKNCSFAIVAMTHTIRKISISDLISLNNDNEDIA
jgi:hypothetical protein